MTALPHRSRAQGRPDARTMVWATVLTLATVLADVVIGSPMLVLPELLDHLDTDHVAWVTASAMLAGALWSPLLAKSSDIIGARRVLVGALLLAGVGALVCFVAPTIWIFLAGRLFQGAAFATVFLSVALTRQVCAPRAAMVLVGLVTSGSSIVGVVEPFLMKPVVDLWGFRSVFLVAAALAGVSALGVRLLLPESPVRGTGRIDVLGALLLGVGLGALLGYAGLGADLGWWSGASTALLAVGIGALISWALRTAHVAEPIIEVRSLSRPILLTLATLILAAGSFRSMLQLISIVAHVPPDAGLGYGLGQYDAIALLLAAPNVGIVVGGVGAGWVARRVGPAVSLLGGIAVGTVGTFVMLSGVAVLPAALASGALLGVGAGAIGASGFNLATTLAAPDRQATVAGVVSLALALGSVVVTIAGAEILATTRIPGVSAAGAPASTAAGIDLYVALAGLLFLLATVPALAVLRSRPGAESPW